MLPLRAGLAFCTLHMEPPLALSQTWMNLRTLPSDLWMTRADSRRQLAAPVAPALWTLQELQFRAGKWRSAGAQACAANNQPHIIVA